MTNDKKKFQFSKISSYFHTTFDLILPLPLFHTEKKILSALKRKRARLLFASFLMDYTGTSSRTVKIRMSTYSHIETPTLPPHRYAGLGCCCPHPLAGRRPAQPLSPVLVHSMTLSYPQGAWNILASQAGVGNIAAAAAKAVLRSA